MLTCSETTPFIYPFTGQTTSQYRFPNLIHRWRSFSHIWNSVQIAKLRTPPVPLDHTASDTRKSLAHLMLIHVRTDRDASSRVVASRMLPCSSLNRAYEAHFSQEYMDTVACHSQRAARLATCRRSSPPRNLKTPAMCARHGPEARAVDGSLGERPGWPLSRLVRFYFGPSEGRSHSSHLVSVTRGLHARVLKDDHETNNV